MFGNNLIFQDDTPCHRSKIVKEWFQENFINHMEWSAHIPDIENL